MAVYVGLMVGPVLGAFLVQNYGWRSIFFVNVPVGILVVSLTTLKLNENRPNTGGAGFDVAGAAALSVALASTLVMLTLGGMF
jgi:MFS family permease